MLKKNITYTDYNGETRNEDHYFNLSKGEMIELEASVKGGFTEALKRSIADQDTPELFRVIKMLIVKAYGEKSVDGKRFEKKNGELAAAFLETEAYSQLLLELFSSEKAAADFFNALMPSEQKAQVLQPVN